MGLEWWQQRWEARRESRRPLPRQTGPAIPLRRWHVWLIWVVGLLTAIVAGYGVAYLVFAVLSWTAVGLLRLWARRRGLGRPSP